MKKLMKIKLNAFWKIANSMKENGILIIEILYVGLSILLMTTQR